HLWPTGDSGYTAANKPFSMGRKRGIKHAFLVFKFRFSKRGRRTGHGNALASAFKRFHRGAASDQGTFCDDLLRAWDPRYVAPAASAGGSLSCCVADFSGVHSASPDGPNGRALFHELHFRPLLADRMGDRQFGDGSPVKPGAEPDE